MNKRILAIAIVFAVVFMNVLNINAYAIGNDDALPAETEAADLVENIDKYIGSNTIAAAAIAVCQGDRVLAEKHYGYADIENSLAADKNTVYEWGSVTKLLVWVSMMQLQEQGKIDLDTDISEYLPEGFLTKLRYKDKITVTNLMNHDAGFDEISLGLWVGEKNIPGLGEYLKLTEPKQVRHPGELSSYSNWGTALAGYIIEYVSGQAFYEYVDANIFMPLGMNHTSLSPSFDDNVWVGEQRKLLMCYSTDNELLGNNRSITPLYPAGGAVGTLEDFSIFAQAFVTDGWRLLFKSKATCDEMFSGTLFYGDTDMAINCHGWWTRYVGYGTRILWHNGGTNGCSTNLYVEPESGMCAVVMSNQEDADTITNGIMNIVFVDRKVDKPALSKNSKSITGLYQKYLSKKLFRLP